MPTSDPSAIRGRVLTILARECGVARDVIAADQSLGELLSAGGATIDSGQMPSLPVPVEFRLCLLVAAIEDAVGIDLVDHPEFGRFWSMSVGRFVDVVLASAR